MKYHDGNVIDATVERLTIDGCRIDDPRITGVEAVAHGDRLAWRARETILSAGAVHSPAVLLRVGIGPGNELGPLGLPMLADRPTTCRTTPVSTPPFICAPADASGVPIGP